MSSWLGNSCSFQVIPMTSKLGFLFQENYFTYLNFQVVGQTIASSAPACLWNGSQRAVRVGQRTSAQCVQQGEVHKASTIFPGRTESCKTVILTMLLSPEVEFKDCSESNLKQLSENGFPGWFICQGSQVPWLKRNIVIIPFDLLNDTHRKISCCTFCPQARSLCLNVAWNRFQGLNLKHSSLKH